jgi:hypothetical protein
LEERHSHLLAAQQRYNRLADAWSWERRVGDILKIAGLDAPKENPQAQERLVANGC